MISFIVYSRSGFGSTQPGVPCRLAPPGPCMLRGRAVACDWLMCLAGCSTPAVLAWQFKPLGALVNHLGNPSGAGQNVAFRATETAATPFLAAAALATIFHHLELHATVIPPSVTTRRYLRRRTRGGIVSIRPCSNIQPPPRIIHATSCQGPYSKTHRRSVD